MRWMVLVAGLLLAGQVNAQALGPEHCSETAGIVGAAVEGRKAGKPAATIKKGLTRGSDAVKAPYDQTVGPLVDWVFTLDKAALQTDVAGSFEAQCLQYK